MKSIAVLLMVMVCVSSIEIPLLFGGIKADKDGLNFQRGINNNGDGVDHNTNFGWGGGNFGIKDNLDILSHGSRSGPRSSLGVGKDGFNWGAGVVVTERPQVCQNPVVQVLGRYVIPHCCCQALQTPTILKQDSCQQKNFFQK